MANFIQAPRLTPALQQPSAAEAKAIHAYANNQATIKLFRDNVDDWADRVASDIDSTRIAVTGLFDRLNVNLERHISENIEIYSPWTPRSRQPRMLARAASNLKSASRLIQLGFENHRPASVRGSDRHGRFDNSIVRDFLCAAFWEEIRVVQSSEIEPTAKDIFFGLSSGSNLVDFQMFDEGLDNTSFWSLHKERIVSGFLEDADSENPMMVCVKIKEGKEQLFHTLFDEDEVEGASACVDMWLEGYRTDVIGHIRNRKEADTNDVIQRFKRLWAKKSTFVVPKNYELVDLKNVEISKFLDIVSGHLETENTHDSENGAILLKDEVSSAVDTSSLHYRLREIDQFAAENPGKAVSGKMLELFPEFQRISELEPSQGLRPSWTHKIASSDSQPAKETRLAVPEKSPAMWRDDKLPSDTPPDFIKRHYGPWLKSDATGLTRPDIKRLDPSLYMALANWLRKNELPDDCPVPNKSERVNAELDRFVEGGISAIVTGPSDPEHVLREARRMAAATQRRR